MLWAAVHLPDLSLQLRLCGTVAPGPVLIQDESHRPRVLSCNDAASGLGVQPGMPVSAAFALAAGLQLFTRDPEKETKALKGVALWAGQFTPTVSIASGNEVLLEIGGCLRLFGGLRQLGGRIRANLRELGYHAVVAVAPTATGALLLSRAGIATCVGDRHELRRALAPLRLRLLDQPADTIATLAGMGVHTIRDYLALPRDGLARRFGQRLLDEIDRALGHLPDPRPPFTPPARYAATLELPAPVQETEPLLFAAKRLILELAGYLAMKQAGVTQLRFELEHAHRSATRVAIGLSAANRDAAHLLTLLREKLATVELPAPVETIRLIAAETRPLGSHNRSLFADQRPAAEDRWRVIEHLRARLGADAVYGLGMFPDHRPELALRRVPAGKAQDGGCDLYRPLWLLARPLPLKAGDLLPQADGPLTLLDGPERIESGWWDDFDVTRDYFVARDASGVKLWIFRERNDQKNWFLHGVFN
jgi:protein ImuB